MKRSPVLFAVLAALQAAPAQGQGAGTPAAPVAGQTIVGWVENGWIGNPPIRVKVKLDTGAKNSSINAPHYREFEKDGKRHVSFMLTNNEGHEVEIQQPVVRTATIRRAGIGKRQRPVIRLAICVAGVTAEVEFTMADRSELNYPVLVGRTFLADRILIDPGRTFIASGPCKAE